MRPLSIIVVIVAFVLEPVPLPEPLHLSERLLAITVGILAVAAAARWISLSTVARLYHDFDDRFRTLARFERLRKLHNAYSVAVFVIVVQQVGWNYIVRRHWGLDPWPLIDQLLILTPYLFAEILSLLRFYEVEHAVRRSHFERGDAYVPYLSRRAYLWIHLQSQLGIWLGVALLISVLVDSVNLLLPGWAADEGLVVPVTLTVSLLALGVSPLVIRLLWRAEPLPPGPLRSSLDHMAERLSFRVSDILVLKTGNGIANAMITGMLPQIRYVLFSDALVNHLLRNQVRAVFGHEMGHIHHRHMPYYFTFVVGSIVTLSLLADRLFDWLPTILEPSAWRWVVLANAYVPIVVWLVVPYFAFVFGYLSRQFEQEADLYGTRVISFLLAEDSPSPSPSTPNSGTRPAPVPRTLPLTAEGVEVFTSALDRTAFLNGSDPGASGWLHDSIRRRIQLLEGYAEHPARAAAFERWVRWLRYLFLGILALSLVLLLRI